MERTIDGFTLAEAREMLQEFKGALKALASGQSYSINGRALQRADGPFVREQIRYFAAIERQLLGGRRGGARLVRAVPRDS